MKYSFDSPVRFSEVDQDLKLTIPALVNYFQDAAAAQAEALGIGTRFLAKRGQGWLVLSWQIVIDSLPQLADTVTATTWGYDFKQMMALRNCTLTGQEGQRYAHANSVWMLFDFQKQKPVRVPEEEKRLYDPEPRLEMDYSARKILIPKDSPGGRGEAFRVDLHHLDSNHHVNNGQYIQMAMAVAGETGQVRQLRAEYRNQALLGDVIVPVVYRKGEQTIISLENEADRPYCVVEMSTKR